MLNAKFIGKGQKTQTKNFDGKTLQLLFKSGLMEGILIELNPMTGFDKKYKHKGEEMHMVIEGEVEFTIGEDIYLCREGDILWHRSDIEHAIKNPGMSRAAYLTILSPPSMI